jgi:hypothetical protein
MHCSVRLVFSASPTAAAPVAGGARQAACGGGHQILPTMEFLAFGSSLHGRMDAEFCLSCYTGYTPIRFNVHELCISVLFCHPTSLVIAELCICIF